MFCKRVHKRFVKRTILFVLFGTVFGVLYVCGVFTHLHEKDFYSEFNYPVTGDISVLVNELREGRKLSSTPLNQYRYKFVYNCRYKCVNDDGPLSVVYIVKSAVNNLQNREAIRKSWGLEQRFPNVQIRTVFMLGVDHKNLSSQESVALESERYGDVVQADFIDAYYNNTIKSVTAFKWAVKYCNNSKFYLFVDDDYYVSTKNLLLYLKNPLQYPNYLTPNSYVDSYFIKKTTYIDVIKTNSDIFSRKQEQKYEQLVGLKLPAKKSHFSGYVWSFAHPVRLMTSKWYISMADYPFRLYPPYIAGGAFTVSTDVLLDIYYGSFFTKHFIFDDVYIGMIAYKLKIVPFHCDEFHSNKKYYSADNYRYVVASHGYKDPEELLRVWNEQRSLGNA